MIPELEWRDPARSPPEPLEVEGREGVRVAMLPWVRVCIMLDEAGWSAEVVVVPYAYCKFEGAKGLLLLTVVLVALML